MSLSCIFPEMQRDIGRKSPFEPTPSLFGDPVGVIPLKFRLDFWRQKTRVPGLSYGVVCMILRLAVLIQYRRVADGRADRDTRRQHIPR